MNKNKIIELENFIFKAKEKPGAANEVMADIIGVLIDLKPAMMGDFGKNELKNLKVEEFEELLDKLKLKRVYFEHYVFVGDEKRMYKYFCISKKIRLAEQTHQSFIKLWSTMNNDGEIIDRRRWKKFTKRIGKLLGYPKTAIIDFVKDNDLSDSGRIERMKRNRYYAHSAKYEDKEFRLYDQKLNRAISKFAPKTAESLIKNKEKRWLV